MKKRIVGVTLTAILMAVMGCNANAASNTISKGMAEYSDINMIKTIRNAVVVQHTKTQEEYDRLTHIIENRNGKIIIEIIDATVLDNDGNGSEQFGFYVKYDSNRFSKGDKAKSIFVYNTDTNYLDDIVCRMDSLIE